MNDNGQAAELASTGPPEEETVCSCGTKNSKESEFCSHCGTELKLSGAAENALPEKEQPPQTDPLAAEELKFLTLPKIPIRVLSTGLTHVGLIKENNEDAFVVRTLNFPHHQIAVHVAIVTDGMGGEPAGEKFGQIAAHECWLGVDFLLPYFEQQYGFQKLDFWRFINNQISNNLQAPIASANSRVIRYGRAKQFKAGEFGCTIVMVIAVCDLETGRVVLHGYNEGDARCALVIGGELKQLSRDHTMAGNPFRFLGRHDHVSGTPFTWEVWMGEADFQSFNVLLYSDGLWNMLSPEQIAQCTNSNDPEVICQTLINEALRVETPHGKTLGDEKVKSGDDNITITAISIATE